MSKFCIRFNQASLIKRARLSMSRNTSHSIGKAMEVSRLLKGIILTILLIFFTYYYLLEAVRQYTNQLTNTAKYEVKLSEIKAPTLTICFKPKWKINQLRKVFNYTESIFHHYYKEELPNNFTIYDAFSITTFKLNQDFLLYFKDSKTGKFKKLREGENNFEPRLKVKSINGMNNGQCLVIIPFEKTLLKPGSFLRFILMHDLNATDIIKEVSLSLTSQNDDYLYNVWTGLPGVKPENILIDASKIDSVTLFYNQVEQKYIKECTEENDKSVFQDFAQEIIKNKELYNCSNFCIPIAVAEILDTINHSLEYCKRLKDYYCSIENLGLMSKLGRKTTKRCLINYADVRPMTNDAVDGSNDGMLWISIALGENQLVYKEYFVKDTLDLIGTVGGTLGLFIGFSFFDAFSIIVDFFVQKFGCAKRRLF